MPAINPSKLRLRSARLAEQHTQPGVFIREMHNLLMFYADNTHRPGKSGSPSVLLDSYNTAPPVLRSIWVELKPIAENDPVGALALCDALWLESFLEHRILACMLLGQVTVSPPDPICERLQAWTNAPPEEYLADALLNFGMVRLRRESPGTLLSLIEPWLKSPNSSYHRLGLRALVPLVEDNHFENLPVVFHMLTPLLRTAPYTIRPDLVELLRVLAQRSPNELAYTLKTLLGVSDSPDTAWLIRKVLPEFPGELQTSLRQALKNASQKP